MPQGESGLRLDFVFAVHDDAEIGRRMVARIAKRTSLTLADR